MYPNIICANIWYAFQTILLHFRKDFYIIFLIDFWHTVVLYRCIAFGCYAICYYNCTNMMVIFLHIFVCLQIQSYARMILARRAYLQRLQYFKDRVSYGLRVCLIYAVTVRDA